MTERWTRRDLLAALGAGAAVGSAGCLSAITSTNASGGTAPAQNDSDDVEAARNATQEAGPGIYAEVYQQTISSVALLVVRGPRGRGGGSGFVYRDDYLVTNHHVVSDADGVDVQFADDDWTEAEVVGTDAHSDLAVIEVEDRPEYATPLPLAEDDPVIGEEVMALGNPLGYESSVSRGIVSGRNRRLPSPTGFSIPNAIQTDTALNPGNSGGPLVDLDGEVVAVITAGAGEGLGFGISAALARRVVPALIEDGEFEHSYVGIRSLEVDPLVAEANDLEEITGVFVRDVLEGSPADGVLRGADGTTFVDGTRVPSGGDVIRALDGTEIDGQNDLSTFLALETDPGDTIEVDLIRDGEETAVDLTLGSRSEHSPERG